ncbi:hypothetical protein GPL26_16495 [Enterocloster citroniae]|uniref:Uncharacterized protein n=1 Tax=Enterocloster citroniae TaxID=358743 RepID=A0AA41K617_9FIRM|nr:hypothetical protein [Enterocloster citroniae]MBT9811226.1 hypothetical protein [Enterocloster citroniae]RGC10060.1 hypothetical protein DWZ14_15460 [Enterocloster citroniae]
MDDSRKQQYKRQNNWAKEKYKRIALNIPKEMDTPIKDKAKENNLSVNEYINTLIINDLKNIKATILNPRPALTVEEEMVLEKYNQLTERNKGKAEEKIDSLIEEQTKDNDNMQHGRLYG